MSSDFKGGGRGSRSGTGGRSWNKSKTSKPRRPGFNRGEMLQVGKCRFCIEKLTEIDYKDVNRLKRYITEKGKIITSRSTGTCAKHQRQLANAIKIARFIALLPYVGE